LALLNLRFIETFVWVTRLRNFTAAAEKLNATQAAISTRIATLEEDRRQALRAWQAYRHAHACR